MIIDCISELENIRIEDGSFLVVKVGSDDRPAMMQDIEDTRKLLEDLQIPSLKYLITHHNIDFKLFTCDKGR